MDTHIIVPDTLYGASNPATTAPDILRKALTSRENEDGQNRAVSVPHTFIAE